MSETFGDVTIGNVPTGAILSAGTNGDGTDVPADDVQGLTITPPEHDDSDISLTTSVTFTEGSTTQDFTGTVDVVVNAVVDDVSVTAVDTTGDVGTPIDLDISPSLVDTDGSETVQSIVISNIPTGAVLSAGIDNGDGSYTLTEAELTNLTINPVFDETLPSTHH